MVKVRYTGPDPMFRQRLRNSWRDAADQMRRVRPLGPEYEALETYCRAVDALHVALYGEPVALRGVAHEAGNGGRGFSPP